jgi:hypothetical protein
MVKEVAVYGTYEARVPVRQRYWKLRNDGVRQRYWKKTRRTKKAVMSGRYEFSGSGKDLYKAVVKAHDTVPKGYVKVSADDFLKNPDKYGLRGSWIDRQVQS